MLVLLLLVGAATVHVAYGQPFEYVYGGDCYERGYDVIPVVHCDGGGYIAVGRTNSQSNDGSQSCLTHTDIYVVRTNSDGARLWEKYYNVSQGARNDEGHAIIECADGSGFVIAGTTINAQGTSSDAVLLKIDCDGGFMWMEQYNPGTFDGAFDLVEAKQGNGGSTNAGDLIVCGTTQSATSYDGLIFRTTSVGGIIWLSRVLLTPPTGISDESFFGVLESQGSVGPGDIVAAGGATFSATGTIDAYVARVNGNNGQIGVAPQGTALYGGAFDESFYCVKELTVANETSNLVFAGMTTSRTSGATRDIYLVKTAPNPCTQLAQNTIDNATTGTYDEMARDIIEVTATGMFPSLGSFNVGDLALTGFADFPVNGSQSVEMILVPVAVGTLTSFGTATNFGDLVSNGLAREEGYALEGVADGFILCGQSYGNLEQDIHPDPEDLYLVNTDADGHSNCDRTWYPTDVDPDWNASCPTPTVVQGTQTSTPEYTDASIDSDNDVCINGTRPDPCEWCKPTVRTNPSDPTGTRGSLSLSVAPNPTRSGEEVRVQAFRANDGFIDLIVTDIVGREVYRRRVIAFGSATTMMVATDNMAAGTYTITVVNGSQRRSVPIVVVP
jgi:hypothetical protein